MAVKLPVFTRCCFCLPLRRGLLTWGYLKLASAGLLMLYLDITLYYNCLRNYEDTGESFNVTSIVILVSLIALLILDVVMHAILVAGAYRKNLPMLRAYYTYTFSMLVLTALLSVIFLLVIIAILACSRETALNLKIVYGFIAVILNLIVQVYILLLVRSEMLNLGSGNCRYMNSAINPQCNLLFVEEKRDITDMSNGYMSEGEADVEKTNQLLKENSV